jgi:hypothetical protein
MSTEESVGRPTAPNPPPAQPGPHFAIVDGLLDVVRHPSTGLNLSRLEKLLPALRDAVAEARDLLGRSNSHARLARRLALYDALLAGEIADLDYELMATLGIQLANAEAAAQREIEDRVQPSLEDDAQAALADVLNLNALVVLSTDVGQQILDDAAKWDRTVAQQRAFKDATIEIAESIEKSGIATTAATELLSQSSTDIGAGPQPERSSVVGQRVIMSAGLALVAGAVASAMPLLVGPLGWIATVVIGEGIKKSDVGQVASRAITETINDPSRLKRLANIGTVVRALGPKFRTIAGDRREFRWVHEWLDFVEGPLASKTADVGREQKILTWISERFPSSVVLLSGGDFDYLVVDERDEVIAGVSFIENSMTQSSALGRYFRAVAFADVPVGIVCVVTPAGHLSGHRRALLGGTEGKGVPLEVVVGHFSSSTFLETSSQVVWKEVIPLAAWTVIDVEPLYMDYSMSQVYSDVEGLRLEAVDGQRESRVVAALRGSHKVGDIVEFDLNVAVPATVGAYFFRTADQTFRLQSDAPNKVYHLQTVVSLHPRL